MRRAQRALKRAVNWAVAPLGVEIRVRQRHDWSDVASFIPLQPTLDGARAAGLSVGDYIDEVMNGIPGATAATLEQMAALGVFAHPPATVLEIGPGSGRYLEKTLQRCAPARYEIYETAAPWAEYVVREYGVVHQPTDGKSLAPTITASVDLLQAHKVFSGIDFLPTARYWLEMARVTRAGGFVVFDIVTENCMDPATLRRWTASGFETGSYPALVPRSVAVDFFAGEGFAFVGAFIVPMGPGTTETLVFRRQPPLSA